MSRLRGEGSRSKQAPQYGSWDDADAVGAIGDEAWLDADEAIGDEAWLDADEADADEAWLDADTVHRLTPMWSWQEFVDRARAFDSIADGAGRSAGSEEWAGASWEEAMRLAQDGWTTVLPEVAAEVAELRGRVGEKTLSTVPVPVWDVTGSEVDVGAYLSGTPECMVDSVPQQLSTSGRVVSFLVPAAYSSTTPRAAVHNRGVALAALCSSILATGHSVEIWSGYGAYVGPESRYAGVARVVSAAEPLDIGRLIFVMAHPAMLRRLWFGVWDSEPAPVAGRMCDNAYGAGPFGLVARDLPEAVTRPYVLPHLSHLDHGWSDPDTALRWCREMFTGLGLLRNDLPPHGS
ncbi:hypothetical protein MTQ01_00175 [Streptomyces sp. XM4193]|uniref:DUF7192 family protein n=1 Tax=Streptomyces sp. XM4193 TaxID=2929782 RepID=UPI001FF89700|nr:hypothetical protein [Streptomyces sp. XM4193]MCK1794470.1 hypothetical protein [Streptomyces sp. XM4193]